ncbi:MAG: Xaa-Pro aminopeptidase [Akkermansiaceae bacterium]|jgi:Xaa-Pro aminopeptidase
MFQSFEVTSRPEQGPPRLAALRTQLKAEGLDGFLVPRADAHQGEYVAPHDERLSWLTGFTGSAGFCAALMDVAGVFIYPCGLARGVFGRLAAGGIARWRDRRF